MAGRKVRNPRKSVDLDRPAFDAVHAGGAAEQVGPADEHFAGASQRNTGLAATEHDLLVGAQHELLAVELYLDRFCLGGAGGIGRRGWRMNHAKDDWLLRIALFEHENHFAPN